MRSGAKVKFARQLRGSMTDAEQALWKRIRRKQTGHRFRRQHPVGPYIADFACIDRRLIVEIDGGQHASALDDDRRTCVLQEAGHRVLRFWNTEVLQNIDGVLEVIQAALAACPRPGLPPQAGEGEQPRLSLHAEEGKHPNVAPGGRTP